MGQFATISRPFMKNIRGLKGNTKWLILTCLWMLTIVGCWGQHIISVKGLQPPKDFNISKASGTWYAVEKHNTLPLSLHSCLTITVKASNYGDVFPFANSAYIMLSLLDMRGIKEGYVGFAISFAPGMLLASVFDPEYTEYLLIMVLATDYDNYAVLTNCVQEPKLVCREVFILTRKRQPSESSLQNARQAIRKRGFPLDDKIQIDQTHCGELEGE